MDRNCMGTALGSHLCSLCHDVLAGRQSAWLNLEHGDRVHLRLDLLAPGFRYLNAAENNLSGIADYSWSVASYLLLEPGERQYGIAC